MLEGKRFPDTLQDFQNTVRSRFEESKRVLSFGEFMELCHADPYRAVRNAPAYVVDAVEHFGFNEEELRGRKISHARIFQQGANPVVGQEDVQRQLLRILRGFQRAGRPNKLIVLHGPNGSAKSSLLRSFFEGLELYSKSQGGWLFSFSWVFPTDNYEKGGLGIGASAQVKVSEETRDSYAKIDQSRIGALVRSELHENPLYLFPKEERSKLFAAWKQQHPELEVFGPAFLEADLSHKNALIFNALLDNYNGDFRKVLRHVRVERLFLNRRMRSGLVTIEPQLSVDATLRQVTLDRSMANLPPMLQSLNLFQLEGDLVDGNRGVVEFDDLLKRPLEHFKYLLGTSETNSVNLAHVVAHLDTVFIGTSNDRQLEAFREHPEFNSFKSRTEFIRVPYLLRVSQETQVYREGAQQAAGSKELMPHTTRVLGLWAVLTRLKPPITKNKSSTLTKVLEKLTPLAKAKLYDTGELPEKLSDDERRELRNHIDELLHEHDAHPYYEGMFGASARELKVLLQNAAQNDQFPTLGPGAVFFELDQLVQRARDFEYLRQEPTQGYFDFSAYIRIVREEWLNWVDREVRVALELEDVGQLSEFLGKYVTQITHLVRGEKVKNRITGRAEDPDQGVLNEFEKAISLTEKQDEFRKNLISRLGAWSIENPNRVPGSELPYAKIFPDLIEKLKDNTHQKQLSKLRAMGAFVLDQPSFEGALSQHQGNLSEPAALALRAFKGLQERYGYGPVGAREALSEVVKSRYM